MIEEQAPEIRGSTMLLLVFCLFLLIEAISYRTEMNRISYYIVHPTQGQAAIDDCKKNGSYTQDCVDAVDAINGVNPTPLHELLNRLSKH